MRELEEIKIATEVFDQAEVKKDCYYISALNKKNALDKLFKK